MTSILNRIETLDWPAIEAQLQTHGYATTGPLLSAQECQEIQNRYDDAALYRSRVVMARHGFGQGEYKYFAYPLPALHQALREALYLRLVGIANARQQAMGINNLFPSTLAEMLTRCHAAGQNRPTPLVLKYAAGITTVCTKIYTANMCFPYSCVFAF